ncbi:hypothetical protein B0H65DRAFT_78010 [Neurospora tetraspora]|uniref:Uncharacterized protein n=1 Tax=Neurospora tetraspora TaxID=94610 RepID=A0AAE0J190_9PEZI|nr:hypothetical protein B0H65DRAFT_78010 [Neurospora tetraspora]
MERHARGWPFLCSAVTYEAHTQSTTTSSPRSSFDTDKSPCDHTSPLLRNAAWSLVMRLRNSHQGPSWTRLGDSVVAHIISCPLGAKVSLAGVFVPSLSSCTTSPYTSPKYQQKSPKSAKMEPSKIALGIFCFPKRDMLSGHRALRLVPLLLVLKRERHRRQTPTYNFPKALFLLAPSATALGPSSDWHNVALADAGLADAHSSDPFDTVVELTFWNRG